MRPAVHGLRSPRLRPLTLGAAAAGIAMLLLGLPHAASAQQLDLTRGGPIDITSTDGIEWRQNDKQVIARGNARAQRENVTVLADRLIAHYRPKAPAPGTPGAPGAPGASPAPAPAPTPTAAPAPGITGSDADTSGNEVFRLEADGNVHIFTPTDSVWGDHAIYDLDQSVLLMTGRNLRLTTPQDNLTARDSLEYWAQKHMAVARGNAVVLTSDGKQLAADTLVAYTTEPAAQPNAGGPPQATKASTGPATPPKGGPDDPVAASGKLQKVDALGNVVIRTATDTVIGDRAVYVPDTGIARLAGHVRITRGQNQLNGAEAEVNLKTGISRLLSGPSGRVAGLVVPNDASNKAAVGADGKSSAGPPPKGKSP